MGVYVYVYDGVGDGVVYCVWVGVYRVILLFFFCFCIDTAGFGVVFGIYRLGVCSLGLV